MRGTFPAWLAKPFVTGWQGNALWIRAERPYAFVPDTS